MLRSENLELLLWQHRLQLRHLLFLAEQKFLRLLPEHS